MKRFASVLAAGSLMAGLAMAVPAVSQTAIGTLQTSGAITIVGTVTDVFGNKFVLEDSSGRILVDNGPDWFHRVEVKRGDKMTVIGRPDGGSFEAFALVRADGTRQEIRPDRGPPPWSGGRRERGERQAGQTQRTESPAAQSQAGQRQAAAPVKTKRGPQKVTSGEELPRSEILARLEKAGYTRIDDVDRKRHHWEVEARNRFGEKVEVHIDFAGNIYKEKLDD